MSFLRVLASRTTSCASHVRPGVASAIAFARRFTRHPTVKTYPAALKPLPQATGYKKPPTKSNNTAYGILAATIVCAAAAVHEKKKTDALKSKLHDLRLETARWNMALCQRQRQLASLKAEVQRISPFSSAKQGILVEALRCKQALASAQQEAAAKLTSANQLQSLHPELQSLLKDLYALQKTCATLATIDNSPIDFSPLTSPGAHHLLIELHASQSKDWHAIKADVQETKQEYAAIIRQTCDVEAEYALYKALHEHLSTT